MLDKVANFVGRNRLNISCSIFKHERLRGDGAAEIWLVTWSKS